MHNFRCFGLSTVNFLFVLILSAITTAALAESSQQRFPYEHVFRVTATLTFEGEEIDVDDLIDCRSDYDGPASRAVQLPFETSRWQLPYPTADGGVLIINIMPNTCAAYAEKWAGVSDSNAVFPDGWVPFMHWYNKRDPLKASFGEYYWSQAALESASGRLKVVENFQILYPDQSDEIVALAAQQTIERDIWIGEKPRLSRALFLRQLPVYYRLPRAVWANEPEYRAAPDRPSDVAGLRNFLDQLPQGEGLIFLGEEISSNESWAFSVGDHLWGRKGGTTQGWHGVPQHDQPGWAMFLSKRSFERAQVQRQRVPFRDEWVPTELVDGVLTLRTDQTGLAFLDGGYGEWYREGQRQLNFLNKPFANGPYRALTSLYIFDKATRDLWVQD